MTISNQENCRKRADPIFLTGKFLETTEYYERDATSNYIFQFYIDNSRRNIEINVYLENNHKGKLTIKCNDQPV